MKILTLFAAFLLVLALGGGAVFAGNIDPDGDGHQYAWGENVGWINFEPSEGPGVTVGCFEVTGNAWGENIGWIDLSPSTYGGVTNDGNGNLAGYAWGENVGWISFSCENTLSCGIVNYGVTIDLVTGLFGGYAWGENIGWVNFTLATQPGSRVKTSWGPPVANAGVDQNVFTDKCYAMVTLDGSGSYDPDGLPLTYAWTWPGGGSATGVSPTVALPVGTTVVTLEVSNGCLTDTDQVTITVTYNGVGIFLDNRDPGFTRSGLWWLIPNYPFSYGPDSYYGVTGIPWYVPVATWSGATSPIACKYECSTWWSWYKNMTTQAKYVVYNQGGPTAVLVNQSNRTGSPGLTRQWHNLGTFTFAPGPVSIRLTGEDIRSFNFINADAIKLVPVP